MPVIPNSARARSVRMCARRSAAALFVVTTLQALTLTGWSQKGAAGAPTDVPDAKAPDEESAPPSKGQRDPLAALREEAMRSLEPAKPPATADPSTGPDTIGGSVVDEDGLPIQGAKLEVRLSASRPALAASAAAPGYVDLAPSKTDAKGLWVVTHVPVGVVLETPQTVAARGEKYSVLVTHPEFLSERYNSSRTSGALQDGDFRKKSAKIVLKRGLVLRGVVRDEQGRGIAGATIQRNIGEYDPRATTDGEGKYVLKSARPGDFVVRARGRGFALQQQRAVLSSNQTVDFTLQQAHTVTLMLRDAQGRPITEGQVNFMPVADKWLRGDRFWVAYPNRSGLVVWNEAPAGEVVASLGIEGYQRVDKKVAVDTQATIILQSKAPLPAITLRVTSADTGKPLPDCTIETGFEYGSAGRPLILWQPPHGSASAMPTEAAGEYLVRVSEYLQQKPLRLRVRCKGHAPVMTASVDAQQGNVTLAVPLQRREASDIMVVGQDGTPAANATIQVMWGSHPLAAESADSRSLISYIGDFSLNRRNPEFLGVSGNDGRCVLPACADEAIVFVSDDSGYVLAPYSEVLKNRASLRMRAYRPGEDRLRQHLLPPAADEKMRANPPPK